MLYYLEDRQVALKMLNPLTRKPVPVRQSLYACHAINNLIPRVLDALNTGAHDGNPRWWNLIDLEFLANTGGDCMVCFTYSQPFQGEGVDSLLQEFTTELGCEVVIRAKKQRFCSGVGRLVQWYEVAGVRYPQVLADRMFSQCNREVCGKMLQWAVDQAQRLRAAADGVDRDLLELYCGNGNFTLPMSSHYRKVVALERDKRAVQFA
eukprot:1493432-Amphidinium_carterae.2